ncbi:DnaJ domain-containing protein [Histoplasma capsulatum G186AR]|uniref:DnaJ domain-containing protein n=1 Tax=Ajellomyces capsulatus TaxID=5037 RepID=A0A8H8D7K1_AJECA|nr:DnaJ domain-containing protein [Histoplasma capsulatum]QSS69517.1 DnaJ domain-containing protein [Histoplasma capsulatum G186AR]
MPLRLHRLPLASPNACLRSPPNVSRVRPFSQAASLSAEAHSRSYYEILDVPVTATTAEIKKKFYALSLAHHPDRNPNDPSAHTKFSSISSAYHVLSHASRRARYDRDHNIHPSVHTPNRESQHRKTSYVGSRPPSGLRKERGAFHGPPPSFYAHGGYGTSNHARHKHASNAASAFQSSHTTSSSDPESSFLYNNRVSHFDAKSHFRTQSHEDERRRLRRYKAMERQKSRMQEQGGLTAEDTEGSMSARFFIILTVVGLGALAASLGRTFGPQQPAPAARGHSVTKN